jgi:Mg2+/citrate symporter
VSYYALSQLRDLIVQSLLIIGLVTVIVTPWVLKARERKRIHEALSRTLDKGVIPSPELLRALTQNSQPATPARSLPQRDLRKGIIWLSIALGSGVLALSVVLGHDPKHLYLPITEPLAALGIAGLPGAIGLGYIILWFVSRKDSL